MNEAEILKRLDELAETFEFPGFNNENYETVDARMHLFRNPDGAWALLVEEAVHWLGAGGPQTILFGTGPLIADGGSGLLADFESPLEPIESDDDGDFVGVTLRGVAVDPAPVRVRAAALGVEASFAVLVHLSETRRDELFSTVEELRDELTPNAVHLLTIADWCHPNVYHGAKPSASEAFQQVARVCRTGDTTAYVPTEAPNNREWRFWLDTV